MQRRVQGESESDVFYVMILLLMYSTAYGMVSIFALPTDLCRGVRRAKASRMYSTA